VTDLPTAGARAPATAPDRAVVGFDGSPAAVRAARFAIALLPRGTAGATLWLVYAYQPDTRLAEPVTDEGATSPVRAVQRSMETLARTAAEAGLQVELVVREGPAAETVVAVARQAAAGWILVGSRGLGPASRVFLGSVSAKIVELAAMPVTVVP
jgi:nucleotide-binding universal stress UspA family protein